MNVAINNLRELSNAELELVSGGNNTIVVTGGSDYWSYDPWSFLSNWFDYDQSSYDAGDYGGGGGDTTADDHSVAEATEAALEIIEAKHNVVKDLIDKYGPNAAIKLQNGEVVTLSHLLEGIDKVTFALQAGVTVAEVVDGGKDMHDAINFAFGVTVSAMAAEAGAGAFLAGALGFTAEMVAGHILEWMEQMGEVNRDLAAYFNAEVAQWVENNSDVPAGTYDTPMDAIRGMFGWPTFNGNYNIP